MPLNSFEIYGIASRCPQKWWKALFLKVLFDVFFWKMRKNKHIFVKLTFKIVHFIRFVWRALSSGALSYPDISGNIRVKSQFENVTSRQFSMKIAIFSMVFINKNNWKLVLIISLRNEWILQFCKVFGIQVDEMLRKVRSKQGGTLSGGLEHEIWTFFISRIRKINRYNGFWFVLERCEARAIFRAGKDCWKQYFLIEFYSFSVSIMAMRCSCGRRFLQNLANRRFRKVMIKTSFQLFLLIKLKFLVHLKVCRLIHSRSTG